MDSPERPLHSMSPPRRFRHIHVLSGPRAGMVLPAPPPSDFQPGWLFFDDEDMAAAMFGDDDDDYLAAPASPTHRSSKRPRLAATSEAILSLQEVPGRSCSGEECTVCLQDFRADETLRAMPCSHAFHQHCISEWLGCNAACPLCRRRLPEEEEEEEEEEDKQRRI